jgi:hypothetical protein
MKPSLSPPGDAMLREPMDFSLVQGGPLFQLLRRSHLSGDALQLLGLRIILIPLFAWLPLLLLSVLEGDATGGSVAVPFLRDIDAHVRFLATMPLLILAEVVVHQRMRPLWQQFVARRLIPDDAMPRFEAAARSAFRLRNSVPAEVILIALVYGVGVLYVWRHFIALHASTWYATPAGEGSTLTWAGIWYGYVSLPFFQFLLCRWYLRLFIWARFLWQVSRIPLNLVPTHPDRTAGLGFLPEMVYAFAPLAAAHGAMLAGFLANQIFFLGASLTDFKAQIAVLVVFVLCLVLGPLLLLVPQLAQAKQTGTLEYDTLAERYVREFDAKWLRDSRPAREALLGSADIQSLAGLADSLDVVRGMRILPVTKEAVFRLAITTLLPVAPLMLTMMPLEALVKMLIGILV